MLRIHKNVSPKHRVNIEKRSILSVRRFQGLNYNLQSKKSTNGYNVEIYRANTTTPPISCNHHKITNSFKSTKRLFFGRNKGEKKEKKGQRRKAYAEMPVEEVMNSDPSYYRILKYLILLILVPLIFFQIFNTKKSSEPEHIGAIVSEINRFPPPLPERLVKIYLQLSSYTTKPVLIRSLHESGAVTVFVQGLTSEHPTVRQQSVNALNNLLGYDHIFIDQILSSNPMPGIISAMHDWSLCSNAINMFITLFDNNSHHKYIVQSKETMNNLKTILVSAQDNPYMAAFALAALRRMADNPRVNKILAKDTMLCDLLNNLQQFPTIEPPEIEDIQPKRILDQNKNVSPTGGNPLVYTIARRRGDVYHKKDLISEQARHIVKALKSAEERPDSEQTPVLRNEKSWFDCTSSFSLIYGTVASALIYFYVNKRWTRRFPQLPTAFIHNRAMLASAGILSVSLLNTTVQGFIHSSNTQRYMEAHACKELDSKLHMPLPLELEGIEDLDKLSAQLKQSAGNSFFTPKTLAYVGTATSVATVMALLRVYRKSHFLLLPTVLYGMAQPLIQPQELIFVRAERMENWLMQGLQAPHNPWRR